MKRLEVRFLGGYDSSYPRNVILRRGLRACGVEVSQCSVRPGFKIWVRYPLLFLRWLCSRRDKGNPAFLLVPEFCQKDVPLAKALGLGTSRRVVFDPLASRFETKILDWQRKRPGSMAAWWNRKIDLWALRLPDLVLSDTQAHKDYYCREFGLAPEKVEVLPVGFDDEVFSPELNRRYSQRKREKMGFTVFFSGSFLPLHGAEIIVQAANLVAREDAEIIFLLVGSGQTLPAAKRLALELNLSNIRFEGWKNQEALAEMTAREADLCLGIFGQTEKAERVVPHKIYQAMALGKPVITARTPAIEEFFSHGWTIFLCEKGNPGSLAQAILRLKKDARAREGIASNGSFLVRNEFNPAALGRQLVDILGKHFPV